MKMFEQSIVPLLEAQFPDFYHEDGSQFVNFVKAYYEWMESANNALYNIRNMPKYRDVDTSVDQFFLFLKEKYLKNIQFEIASNKKLFIKNALSFYRSKGTEQSVDLFFKLIYGEDATVYYPADDIFKTSSGTWVKPKYIEISNSTKSKDFVNKQIIGLSSRATAFVEKLIRRKTGGTYVNVFYISSINGDFRTGETLILDDGENDIEDAPVMIGSLTTLDVIYGGSGFAVGDIVDLISEEHGTQGKARVMEVESTSGVIDFEIIHGGWGFSTNSSITDVYVSEKVLTIANVTISNTSPANVFTLFESVSQPMSNVSFNISNNDFANGDTIYQYHANGLSKLTGKVLSMSQNSASNSGWLLLSVSNGAIVVGDKIYKSGNGVAANAIGHVDKTATANVIGMSSNLTLYAKTVNATAAFSFNEGDEIYTVNSSSAETANAIIEEVSFAGSNVVISVANVVGLFVSGQNIQNRTANGIANLYSYTSTVGMVNISNNGFVTFDGNFVRGAISNNTGSVSQISFGSGASFEIGNTEYDETLYIGTDLLSGNNSANVPYVNIYLDGHGSKIGSVFNVDINNGGTGYNSGSDTIVFTGGDPTTNATATFANNGSGVITTVTIATGGAGYNSTPTISVSTAGGSGANLTANMYFGYGFPKATTVGYIDRIYDALSFSLMTIGKITKLTNISPGEDYNVDPFVLVHTPSIVPFNRKDYYLECVDETGNFVVGEEVRQVVTTANSSTLVVTSAGVFQGGEFIYSSNGTSNIATGIVSTANITSNSGTILVTNVVGAFDAAYDVRGLSSNASANVSSVSLGTYDITAKGLVKTVNNTSNGVLLTVERISFNDEFTANGTLSGVASGVTATILSVTADANSKPVGMNANITANTNSANGSAAALAVVDSGFGYEEDEVVEFSLPDGDIVGTAKISLGSYGFGEGFYRDRVGFLSDDSKLHDGEYYQDYSYEIRSKIPLEKYAKMLKDVLHVAGTRMFGVIYTATFNDETILPVASDGRFGDLFVNSIANSTSIIVGERLTYATNTSANVVVAELPKAEIVVTGANNTYQIGTRVYTTNNTTNNGSGVLTYKEANTTANTTTLYLSNVVGKFSSANVYGISKTVLTIEPTIRIGLRTISGANVYTGSYAIGANVYQSNSTANTAVARAIFANSTVVFGKILSGAFANNVTTYGEGGVTATANGITANVFTASDNLVIQTRHCSIENLSNTSGFTNNSVVVIRSRAANSTATFFANVAQAVVVSANSSKVVLKNVYGNISNGSFLIQPDVSNTDLYLVTATINSVKAQNLVFGTVETANSTSVTVYNVTGEYTTNTLIRTSNSYANVTAISNTYATSTVNSSLMYIPVANVVAEIATGYVLTGNTSGVNVTVTGFDVKIS